MKDKNIKVTSFNLSRVAKALACSFGFPNILVNILQYFLSSKLVSETWKRKKKKKM